eukprot:478171-Amphidinium_carterae.9
MVCDHEAICADYSYAPMVGVEPPRDAVINVRMSIHVDDLLGVGPHSNMMKMFQQLEQHLEVRVGEAMA